MRSASQSAVIPCRLQYRANMVVSFRLCLLSLLLTFLQTLVELLGPVVREVRVQASHYDVGPDDHALVAVRVLFDPRSHCGPFTLALTNRLLTLSAGVRGSRL